MNSPVKIKIGEEDLTVNSMIKQNVFCLKEEDKYNKLLSILTDMNSNNVTNKNEKVLIFRSTKHSCDALAESLNSDSFTALAIHGDKTQYLRDKIIDQFKNNRAQILVATDVASRGLDIKGIENVINYDFPPTVEDYIHRIGRTGRAGNSGESNTFYTDEDPNWCKKLVGL